MHIERRDYLAGIPQVIPINVPEDSRVLGVEAKPDGVGEIYIDILVGESAINKDIDIVARETNTTYQNKLGRYLGNDGRFFYFIREEGT